MSILQTADEPEVSVPLGRLRWTWSTEEAPVKVHVPLDLVARLRGEIEGDARRSVSEIGGVLLGRKGSTPGSIEIKDYAWVPCKDSGDGEPGGEYGMDVAALETLREAHRDLLILGYFRTQLEGALHLRRAEVDFVEEQFGDRSNVVLLIRPSPGRFKAGFLFWEGDTFVPFSIYDFPFVAESLRSAASIRVEIPEKAQSQPVALPVFFADPVPVKVSLGQPLRHDGGHVRRALLSLTGAVTASVFMGFLLQDRVLPAPRLDAPQVLSASVPIELQASAEDKGLDIHWNPQSTPVVMAREAHLALVQPDGRDEIIPVDLLQLESGKIHFASWGESVEVRLEVVDGNGRATRESFSALRLAPELPVVAEKPAAPASRWSANSKPSKWKPAAWKPAAAVRTSVPVVVLPEQNPLSSEQEAKPPVVPVADDAQNFAGRWGYSTVQGRYAGAEPEVVDGVIHEDHGRLIGTMFVHFKRSADGAPDFTDKFQFAGDLHGGPTQVFP